MKNRREDESQIIAIFLPNLSIGGAERVTINLAEALDDRGHNVTILVADQSGGFSDEISPEISLIELNKIHNFFGILGACRSLATELDYINPDILISSLTRANVTATLARDISDNDCKLIGIEHLNISIMQKNFRDIITFKLARFLYHKIDELVAVSEGVAKSVSNEFNIEMEDINIIPNIVTTNGMKVRGQKSVNHDWFNNDYQVVISLGRLSPQKDIPTLLRAFSMVETSNARLLIIGDGKLKGELVSLSKDLEINDRVEFTGYVNNPYKYLEKASLFVLSSEREGLPTVIIEALAFGCPVISTDCPSGPEEILDYGRYGRLTPMGDPKKMAAAIDSELSKTHDSEILKKRADIYSSKEIAKRYESIF